MRDTVARLLIDGRETGILYENFKAALDDAFPVLERRAAKHIEIRQLNLDNQWVSCGTFNLEDATRWYREYEEALERDLWR